MLYISKTPFNLQIVISNIYLSTEGAKALPKGFLAEVLQLPDDHSPVSPLQCNLLWCCCILNPLHPHPHCSQFFPPLQSSSNALSQSLFPGPWQHLTRAGQREQTGRTWGFCQLAVPVKLKCVIFVTNLQLFSKYWQPQRFSPAPKEHF